MTKQRTTAATGLWSRTAQALGKLWFGMISLPDDRQPNTARASWTDYTRFPPF
jgi:hypothetical protein